MSDTTFFRGTVNFPLSEPSKYTRKQSRTAWRSNVSGRLLRWACDEDRNKPERTCKDLSISCLFSHWMPRLLKTTGMSALLTVLHTPLMQSLPTKLCGCGLKVVYFKRLFFDTVLHLPVITISSDTRNENNHWTVVVFHLERGKCSEIFSAVLSKNWSSESSLDLVSKTYTVWCGLLQNNSVRWIVRRACFCHYA